MNVQKSSIKSEFLYKTTADIEQGSSDIYRRSLHEVIQSRDCLGWVHIVQLGAK